VGVGTPALGSHAFTTVRRLMSDQWDDEGGAAPGGGGNDDDWDEGEEPLETEVEGGFDDPEGESDDEDWSEGEEG